MASSPDTKRAFTRFGVVEMPSFVDPSLITADHLLRPTNRWLKIIPPEDLPRDVRKIIETASIERLPALHPKPELTEAQLCLLQIVAELETHGDFDWETVSRHYAIISGGRHRHATSIQCRQVGDCVVRKSLLTAEGPRLTEQGQARVRAQEELESVRERLGLVEYPIVRFEPNGVNPDYDEVYLVKQEKLYCYFRFECFEVRERAKIVVLSSARQW
jgi:hypothetical protein